MSLRRERATPVALFLADYTDYERHRSLPPTWSLTFMDETHGWERATPLALIGSAIDKKSAIGVARSQL